MEIVEQPTSHPRPTKPQWQAPRMTVVGHVTEIVRTPRASHDPPGLAGGGPPGLAGGGPPPLPGLPI